MAPRPNWKGYLKLSLVSCPVALYPATTTSERVSFRTLNRDTGNRVRRQFVDEQTGDAGRDREPGQGLRGRQGRVHRARGRRAQVRPDREQSHHRHRALRAARRDRRALSRYALLPRAHRPRGRGGVRRHPRRHARRRRWWAWRASCCSAASALMMLEPRDKGIVATSLHYANEVHAANAYFEEIPDLALPKEMLELAKHIIEKMSGQVPAGPVRGPLREGPDRADPLQAEGHAGEAAADAPADQRHQPDGCAAPQRRGREGRRRGRRRQEAAEPSAARGARKGKARMKKAG